MTSRIRFARTRIKFKRFKKRFFGFLIPKNPKLSAIQQETFAIIKTLIAHPEALLLYSPNSSIYHIEYENIFVRFNNMHCYVVNSKYSYYIELPTHVAYELAGMFRRKIEKKSNEVLAIYESKMLDNLKTISSSLIKTP